MNACQQTQALLFEKADGRIDPTVRSNLDAHLAICPHCQQVYAMWSGALPRLRGLPTPERRRRARGEPCGSPWPRASSCWRG
jgi:anti-sigma factor RsiW